MSDDYTSTMVSPEVFAPHDVPELNHSSFAYCLTSAMSGYLDAMTEIGSTRKVRISMARACARDAVTMASGEAEITMAISIELALGMLIRRGLAV